MVTKVLSISVDLTTDVGAMTLEGDADNGVDTNDNITIATGLTLTSADSITLDATTSGIAPADAVTLSADNGVTINNSFTTVASGAVTIDADADANGTGDFTLAAGATLNSSVGAVDTVSITADDIILTGSINAGTGNVSLLPSNSTTVGLGAGAGDFSLTDTELDNITTSGTLTIGNSNTTTMTIDGWTAAAGISGPVVLTATGTAGAITFATAASTLQAGLTLTALDGVTLNEDVTSNGATVIDADSDDDGTGGFTVAAAKTLTTTNNDLTITADDMTLIGNLSVGSGDVSLLPSNSTTVGLGAGAGDFSLTDTELDNITTSGTLTIGNSNTTTMTINGWTAAAGVSGPVALTATGTAGAITFATVASTLQAGLTLTALDGVTLNEDVTSNGATIIDADSDDDGTGDFTVAAAKTLTTTNNTLTLTADDIALSGSIDTGSAAATLLVSDAGSIGLGATAGDYTLSGAELQNITATGLTLGDATNGNITVNGITAANSNNVSGTVTLNATLDNATVTFATTASTFNALTANADDGIVINVALTTDVGAMTLEGDADNGVDTNDNITIATGLTLTSADSITLDATTSGIAPADAVTLSADNGVTINNSFTTVASGAVTIDADADANGTGDFTLAAGATLNSSAGAVDTLSITADDVDLSGSINAGTGNVSLLPSNSTTVGLGAGAGDFSLTDTELDNITTSGTLTIGNSNTTTMTINGWTAAAGVSGPVVLTATGTAGAITFATAASTLQAGLTLTALDGVTLNEDVTSNGATVIDADSNDDGTGDFTVAAAKTLTTTNNTLTLTADDIALSGSIDTGSAAVTLLVSDAGTIGLGATAGNYTLSGAELQNITATGLTLGDTTNGSITVNGITAANSNNVSGTVTLNATLDNASVTFATAASTFNALTVNGDQGITISVDLTTDVGAMTLEGDADNAADTNDYISIASGVTLTSADSITLDATTGGILPDAAVTINADNGVTINDNLTTQASGAVTIDADADANGTGDFTLASSKTLNTTAGATDDLTITANDIDLSGSINAGAGLVTLLVSDAGAIGLGATAGDYTLSGAELQNISSTGLTLGDATNGSITVNGITAANSNNVSGTVTLNATLDNASVTFATAASTFNALTANADDGIVINVALTTDVGAMTLEGDADNGVDTNDNITIATGLTLTSADSITLDATTSGIAPADAVTLSADNGVTINNSFTTVASGAVTIDADADANGTGDFTLAAGATLNSSAGAVDTLSITADDIILTGSINAGTGNVSLLPSNSTTVGLGAGAGDFSLADAELDNITTSGTLTIGNSNTTTMTIDGWTAAAGISGPVVLTATGTAGAITFTTVASTLQAGLILTALDGVTLNEDVTSNGATVIDADSNDDGTGDFTVAAAKTLTTTNNTLTLTADDIALTGSIDTGSAAATLLVSDAGTIGLGATAGNYTLSGAELQNITATGLTLGDTTNGSITVNGITAANSNNVSGTVTLNATLDNASVTFATAASIFNALTVNGDQGITISVDLTTDVGAMILEGDADNAADTNDYISIASGVTLTSADSITLDATTGGILPDAAVTINADNGVTINDNLTTQASGAVTIDADADANGTGDFTLVATKTLNSSTGAVDTLSITADDIILSGSINAGAGNVSLLPSNSTTIGLGAGAGDFSLTDTELDNITTSGTLTIGNSNATVMTIDTWSVAGTITGDVVLTATGTAGTVTLNSAVLTVPAALTITALDGVTLNEDVTSNGAIVIDADSDDDGTGDFTIVAAKTLTTTNNTLMLTADDIALSGSVDTGSAAATLLVSDAGAIGLGATAGNYTLSGAELQNITATGLTLGDATNGSITVNGITAANSNNVSGTVTLNATLDNASVIFATAASTFNALTANADDGIVINVALTTDVGAMTLEGDADNGVDTNDNITIATGLTLTSADSITLDATTSGIAPADAVTLSADNGVTINNSFTTVASGAVTIDADADANGTGDFTLAAGATLNSSVGAVDTVSITADDIILTGSINAGTGNVSLLPSNSTTVGLGAGAGDFSLTDTELDNITTSGTLTIGNSNTTTMTIDGWTAAAGISGPVVLTATGTAGAITFATAASTLQAGLTLTALDGVTLNEDVTSNGAMVIDADSDDDGTGDFTVAAAKTLTTTNNALTLTADDIALSGSIDTGSAAATLLVSDAGAIGLGGTAGNYTLSGAELQNITATGLTLGDATNGSITVNGITAANSNNVSGTVTLNATLDNASVTFATAASTFNALTVNGDQGITISVDLTTDVGAMTLEGDADNGVDTNDYQ